MQNQYPEALLRRGLLRDLDGSSREGAAPLAAEREAARRFNQGLKMAAGPAFVPKESDQWRYLLQLVWREFPYCTMFGVHILDGNIVSCENVQRSLLFGPHGAGDVSEPVFDEYWQALRDLSARIKTGNLLELSFNHGRPVSARKSEGGRRFRRLLQQPRQSGPSSANA